MKIPSSFVQLLAVVAVVAAPSTASAQSWTQWTSGGAGAFNGLLFGSAVTFAGGNIDGQLFNGGGSSFDATNYFNPPNAYNQAGLTVPGLGMIRFNGASAVNTVTFANAVVNPYFAFVSVGQPGLPVTYSFNAPFSVLSNNNNPNCAFWGCGTYSLGTNSFTGNEFSGTIQFLGTFSSLTFSTTPGEFWHGFTVGADESVVPEPATMSLLATGLIGMAAARRRRKRVA